MSKKFFSLIHGDKLHLAPETKIIPAESLSTVLDAEEVLDAVKKDAEQYKVEVAGDCEKLKEQAQKEGFEQGYAEWIEKIADLEAEIQRVSRETENLIIPIALKAAKKIVGRELEQSESTVVDIITNSLKSVATHKRIKIYVNRKELDLVEKSKEKLKKVFEHLESLSILAKDDVEPAGCVIETEGGIINAQLENQWLILETAFQKLIKPSKVMPAPQPIVPPEESIAEGEIAESVEEVKEEESTEEEEWEEEEEEDWEDEEEEKY